MCVLVCGSSIFKLASFSLFCFSSCRAHVIRIMWVFFFTVHSFSLSVLLNYVYRFTCYCATPCRNALANYYFVNENWKCISHVLSLFQISEHKILIMMTTFGFDSESPNKIKCNIQRGQIFWGIIFGWLDGTQYEYLCVSINQFQWTLSYEQKSCNDIQKEIASELSGTEWFTMIEWTMLSLTGPKIYIFKKRDNNFWEFYSCIKMTIEARELIRYWIKQCVVHSNGSACVCVYVLCIYQLKFADFQQPLVPILHRYSSGWVCYYIILLINDITRY